jgi:hypothetical protein
MSRAAHFQNVSILKDRIGGGVESGTNWTDVSTHVDAHYKVQHPKNDNLYIRRRENVKTHHNFIAIINVKL